VETADVGVLSGKLLRIADAIDLSRRTSRVVRQNLAVALFTVGALLAGVLAGEVMMAAGMLVHQLSVLVVVLNAMRLLRPRAIPDEPVSEIELTTTARSATSPVAMAHG
jgi:Zn2+/Cd2+-exporting ATPase